ncbi:unnamed protein product [Acanthoscelides obtectus]|uniref:Uncharacterized protein n=1 Tax=Acanthoscelides obtectus TaxID=200917 RepID=A0A9P0P7H6_ACAOB|nr:unnamed protein product [Acanthoscelides obtectus]CAK1662310.1 hypothetical protein AOBTE_LOCUS23077 [Acanthoscelides obtectus]
MLTRSSRNNSTKSNAQQNTKEFIGKLLRKNRFPKRHVGGITEVLVSKRRSRRHKSSFTGKSLRKNRFPKQHVGGITEVLVSKRRSQVSQS